MAKRNATKGWVRPTYLDKGQRADALAKILVEYLDSMHGAPHDDTEEKMLFDDVFNQIEVLYGRAKPPKVHP